MDYRIRAYRSLLTLLPSDMRRRFGADMEEVLLHRLQEARDSTAATAGVWLRAVADVLVQAVVARLGEHERRDWRGAPVTQDLRFAIRSVRAAPGFAFVVVVTLGLGIGASTATYSMVHAVLLRDLPVEAPDRLVFVWPEVNANKAMTLAAAERMPSLRGVAGMSAWTLTLTGIEEPTELTGLQVSPGYFDILGVHPLIGRTFAPAEDLPGNAGVVVLSHDFWVRAFGSDAAIVGRTIDLGGAAYEERTVIGVMPPGVDEIVLDVDVWVPLEGDRSLGLEADDTWYVNQRIARLAPGATLARANSEVSDYAAEVQRVLSDHFSVEDATEATVQPIRQYITRDVGSALWLSLGAVTLVLLIGCFNVANLLLARAERRAHDLAVRVALGAGRARMTRMLLGEALLLGGAGGVLGVGIAAVVLNVVVRLAPESIPGLEAAAVNPSVLIFALAVSAVAIAIAGLLPSLRVAGTAAASGARGVATHTGRGPTSLLVGAQIALAMVVTVEAGLMLRSLDTLLAVDPGIDGQGVLTFKPSPAAGRYPDVAAFRDYYERVMARVAALPAVESVGAINLLPGGLNNWSFPTHPEGYRVREGAPTPTVNFRAVRGDYFEVTGIPLVTGRYLDGSDREGTQPVVVVNEAFVSTFWPDERPLGKTLSIFSATGTRYGVVGVVANVHQHGLDIDPLPEMYFSHGQAQNQMSMWIMVRAHSGDAMAIAPSVTEAVWSIDADVPISGTAHLADMLRESTRTARFLTLLLAAFGGLALALSAIGVFSVTTYTTGRRLPELGLRIALGSSRARVVYTSLRTLLVPVVTGLGLGLAGAAASSSLLASMLFEITPTDPATFAGVALLLALTALFASAAPAWRATRVDPLRVLNRE